MAGKALLAIVTFVALLWCSNAGKENTCLPNASSANCGCTLTTTKGGTLQISLQKLGSFVTNDSKSRYIYQPGCNESDVASACDSADTALCKIHEDGKKHLETNIGELNNPEYQVLSPTANNTTTSVNVSVTYKGPAVSNATSTVFLVCDKNEHNATFSYLFTTGNRYVFELKYDQFCYKPSNSSTVTTTAMPTTMMSMNTTGMPTTMNTTMMPMNTTAMPATMNTTMMPMNTTAMPATMNTTMMPMNTTAMPATMNTTMMAMNTTAMPATMNTTMMSMNTTAMPTTMNTTMMPMNTTAMPTSTTTSKKVPVSSTSHIVPEPSKQGENKKDKNRKVILAVVLSIVGAVIVLVIAALAVFFIKRKMDKSGGTPYEKIPSM